MSDAFFDVPRQEVRTSVGTVELPILYFRSRALLAFFRAPWSVARQLVRAPLTPLHLGREETLVGLAWFTYEETTIGPYNEVGLAVAVAPESTDGPPPVTWLLRNLVPGLPARPAGFHIVDLPVSTEIANAAGRELWGYPKFVTELPISWGARFTGRVLDPDGTTILEFTGPRLPGIPGWAPDLELYSVRRGELLRTVVAVRARGWLTSGIGYRVQLGPSAHWMAEHARSLALDGARPLAVFWSSRWRARLPEGERVPT